MTLQTWQAHRRTIEVALWTAFLTLQATANSLISNIENQRSNLGFAAWEPWVWELSSALVMLALVPFILAVDRHFPLQRARLRRHLLIHLGFSLPYSLVHIFGMVAL